MKVHVADGIEYVKQLSSDQTSVSAPDVLIIDVDSKDVSVGMSCPPVSFVSDEFLTYVKTLLSRSYTGNGMLLINLVCRAEGVRTDVLERIKKVIIFEIHYYHLLIAHCSALVDFRGSPSAQRVRR